MDSFWPSAGDQLKSFEFQQCGAILILIPSSVMPDAAALYRGCLIRLCILRAASAKAKYGRRTSQRCSCGAGWAQCFVNLCASSCGFSLLQGFASFRLQPLRISGISLSYFCVFLIIIVLWRSWGLPAAKYWHDLRKLHAPLPKQSCAQSKYRSNNSSSSEVGSRSLPPNHCGLGIPSACLPKPKFVWKSYSASAANSVQDL